MESIYDYLKTDFASSLQEWEANLKKELKTEDLSGLTTKKTSSGAFPVLGLGAEGHYLTVKEGWKKASQTYHATALPSASAIQEDLESGVRLFFFRGELAPKAWERIEKVLQGFERPDEVQVYFLGAKAPESSASIRTVSESVMASGRLAHELGGNHLQELALLGLRFIEGEDPKKDSVLFLDSEIFANVAKVRALKLILKKITDAWGVRHEGRIIGLNSFQDWTLYERYSNILKNVASVTAGYIGGVDHMQSSGFLELFSELGVSAEEAEVSRSRLMARNTCHILALESMLGVVEDAAFGSFHLENLTQSFAEGAWELIRDLLPLAEEERLTKLTELCEVSRKEKLKRVGFRKQILTGINDFADPREELPLKTAPPEKMFRLARVFEELRIRMSAVKKKPSVFLAVVGDYAPLSARINFAKNYFEVLGLEVREGEVSALETSTEEILVVCASDADADKVRDLNSAHAQRFLAGKSSVEGFQNIFSGQDVAELLAGVVAFWEAK